MKQIKKSDNNHNKSLKHSFSLDQLNKIGNNDEEFTLLMLKQFRVSVAECSESLASWFKEKDSPKLKNAAHKAVPSYTVMQLDELAGLLKTIEKWPEISQDKLAALVELFGKKNKELLAEIDDYLKLQEEIKITA